MMNMDMSSLNIDYPDLYRYNTALAEALIDNPDDILIQFGDALKDIVSSEDSSYAEKKGKFHGYRARIRNHGHSCFLCEIVIRSQFHTTYEPEA
jgi:Predicted ATPase involved in replication control, Cdc46/Mcm family